LDATNVLGRTSTWCLMQNGHVMLVLTNLVSIASKISSTSAINYYAAFIFSLSSSSLESRISTDSSIVAFGFVATFDFQLKMPFRKHSNTSHINFRMSFANWNVAPIHVSNLFLHHILIMMVIPIVKSLLVTQCYALAFLLVFPILHVIFIVFQQPFPHTSLFQVFAIFPFLQLYVILAS